MSVDFPSIRFDGQVAIVTGAGGGMGLEYALELARRGASVVVNDYGGDMNGIGASNDRAEAAAAEVRASGGEAIADSHAVGDVAAARALTAAALEAFGRIDILINNAGISAPGPLETPSDDRAEAVLRTNLLGPYHLTRAVWPLMRQQGYGRILNISSSACVGMGRSAPYAMSKAGLLGLTLDNAREGEALGILVNALMPTAYSRMIEAVPNKDFVAWMRETMPAGKVSAGALYLVSRHCAVTGRIFNIGGGHMARINFASGRGLFDPAISPECVAARIDEATDMEDLTLIERHEDLLGMIGGRGGASGKAD